LACHPSRQLFTRAALDAPPVFFGQKRLSFKTLSTVCSIKSAAPPLLTPFWRRLALFSIFGADFSSRRRAELLRPDFRDLFRRSPGLMFRAVLI
jgi:hypothetical protein